MSFKIQNIILSFYIFLSLKYQYTYSLNLNEKYPLVHIMSNGDLFVITQKGIRVFDQTLKIQKSCHNFTSNFITSNDDISKNTIAQFPNDYIISLYNNILLVCSSEGVYIFEKDLSSNIRGDYYSLIPHRIDSNNYYYIITFFIEGKLSVQYYKLIIDIQENTCIASVSYETYNSNNLISEIMYRGHSCQIMLKEDEEVLACFYEINNRPAISVTLFKISDTFSTNQITEINTEKIFSPNERATVIKSAISNNKKKALICYIMDNNGAFCLNYDIDNNLFSPEIKYINSCRVSISTMNVYYFEDKNEYMFICNENENQGGFNSITFNSDFIPSISDNAILSEPNYRYGGPCMTNILNVLYLPHANDYILINDCSNGDDSYISGNINLSKLSEENNYPIEDMEIYIIGNTNSESNTNNNNEFDTINEDNNIEEDRDTVNSIDANTNPDEGRETDTSIDTIINNEKDRDTDNPINSIINTGKETDSKPEAIINKDMETEKKNNIINYDITKKSKEEMINNIDYIIKEKDPEQSYIINGNDYTVIIRQIDVVIEESTVNIDFSECKKELKNKYPSKEFRIMQINMKNKNKDCLIDQVEYKIYDEKGDEIDLSICEHVDILIEYEIKNSSLLNLEKVSKFKDQGIDVFDLNQSFFYDICYSYSDNHSNSDMILTDRVSDIYQNYSICGEGCEYESFNYDKLSANCICKVKQEVNSENESPNFQSYIQNTFFYTNFGVVKCFNLVFSLKGKLENFGFFIFGSLIIIHIPLYILYLIKGITPVSKYITIEMDNKGYTSKIKKNIIKNSKITNIDETTNQNQNTKEEDNKIILHNLKRRKRKKTSKKCTKENPPKKELKNNDNITSIKKDLDPSKDNYKEVYNNNKFDNELYLNIINNKSINKNEKRIETKNVSNKKNLLRAKSQKNLDKIIRFNFENLKNIKIKYPTNINKSEKEYKNINIAYENEKKENNDKRNKINIKNENDKNTEILEENTVEIKKPKKKKINEKREKKKEIKRLNNRKQNNLITGIESNDLLKESVDKMIKLNKRKKQKNKNYINKLKHDNISNIDDQKDEKEKIKGKEFPLILIDANNSGGHTPLESNYILNNYNYKEAIIYDKRSFCRIFFIFLISKDNILNIIFFNPPLELKPIRICIFIFTYACDFALNALFYLSDNISDKYHYNGANKLLFSLINNITICLVSTIISFILLYFFQSLTQSTSKIENLFRKQEILLKAEKKYKVHENTKILIENEIQKIIKCLKLKIIFFVIFEIIFMLFFFYYVTAFCQVYKNTQISWLLDGISSYVISLSISITLSFICSIFYKLSIRFKNIIIYKIMTFIYYIF